MTTKLSSKRTVLLLLCVGLAILLLFGVSVTLRPRSTPLDHAEVVAQTGTWIPEFGNPTGPPVYYWTAGNTLTYFGKGADGTPHLFQTTGGRLNTPGREGPAVDVRGGYAGQLSPDGKWFVEWHQNKKQQRVPTFVAMDGSRRIVGEPSWAVQGIWRQDGNQEMLCSSWRGKPAMDVYRPDGTPMRKIVMSGVAHFYDPQAVDAQGCLVGFKDSAFFLHIKIAQGVQARNTPSLAMIRLDLAHPDRPAEEWKNALPEGAEYGSCVVSPSGNRLLWIVRGDLTSPILQKLRDAMPRLGPAPKPGVRWLVSGLKGEDMREIAAYPNDVHRTGQAFPYGSPRWMPDSKHISFLHRSNLYVRSVE